MNVLVHVTRPYPVVMWDLIASCLRSAGHTPLMSHHDGYIGLDALVVVTFVGFSCDVVAKGPDDRPIANEVLGKILEEKLIYYRGTRDLDDRAPGATPMVQVLLPVTMREEVLPVWANAIATGVSEFLAKKRKRVEAK